MKRLVVCISFLGIIILLSQACRKPEEQTEEDYNEWLSGGSETVFNSGGSAFSNAFPSLSGIDAFNHGVGDAAFEATFVSAPAPVHAGLGPIFNSVSCASCHIADGRGRPQEANGQMISMLFRVSVPGTDEHGGPLAAPGFGGQLQQRSIVGRKPEADVNIQYTFNKYSFPDGEAYELRTPVYAMQNSYIPLPGGMMYSPRVAPPVFGLGLLEAIPEWAIVQNADETDANGDGISGKANYVWNVVKNEKSIGRFGWKAGAPTLLQQVAGAYNQDMGITNFVFPFESSYGQPQDEQLNDGVQVSDSLLYAATFYMKTLAVPARRNADDATVKQGKLLFKAAGCNSCHVSIFKTEVNVAFKALSNQTIFPYTDLLLHDMGDGLADYRPDYLATGKEWKTPPLWGIGLTQVVNGHSNFLHDGRARTLTEAIMWHGGEASNSVKKFSSYTAEERKALLKFLGSL
ncbi:MAG TPA: di-heme oxidoredictase family protein [Bacteroidia bacterium]|jgi:CxxC motif-containing protein (DUF1111 family)|nr:di-heme oxidoredictase family protein [Bacteroidia bacterium]